MIKICQYCNKEFETSHKNKKFCSRECMGLSQRKRVKKICQHCGKEYEVPVVQDNTSKFCSRDCHNNAMVKNIIKKCEYCGQEFETKEYLKQKFCSNECRKLNKRKRVEKICEYCGKTFEVTFSQKDRRKCCSKECYNKSMEDKITVNCTWCGKEITRKKSKIQDNNFCDLDCLGKWNGEQRKNRIIKVCEVCGKEYEVKKYHEETSVTCSNECQGKWQSINRIGENSSNWRGGGGYINCLYCGKEFYVGKYNYEHNKTKFCSLDCSQKHWVENIITTEDFKYKKAVGNMKMLSTMKGRETSIEKAIKKYLTHNNINFKDQYVINNKFCVDFYLPDYNVIIEAFGDYWHGNPNKYGEGKISFNDMQVKNMKKDKSRIAYLTKCGYKLYCFWESDINNDLDSLMLSIPEIKLHETRRDYHKAIPMG